MSGHFYKDRPLWIVVHTKSIDSARIFYESVVGDDNLEGRVEMYIDPERALYKNVGFDWRLKAGEMIFMAMKMVYGKMFKDMDKESTGWDQQIVKPVKDAPKDIMEDYSMRRFMKNENPAQQGGDVVLDDEGKIVSIFQMSSVEDRVSLKDLGLE